MYTTEEKIWYSILIIAFIWDVVWKLIGLWKSARKNQLIWFICIAVFNTAGILPIVYILLENKNIQKIFQKQKRSQ